MKKIAFAVLLTIMLCACGAPASTRQEISLPITVKAVLKNGDSPFTAEIAEGECEIFFEDGALSGLSLRFDENGGKASVASFVRDVNIDVFPAQKALVEAVRALSDTNIKGTKTEFGMKYAIDETSIMVYYDEDTGNIIGIEAEENGRRFVFDIAVLKA